MKTADFRKLWAGRTFLDRRMNHFVTIPDDVRMGEIFRIGTGYVDVGDGETWRLVGDIEEVELFEDGEYVVLSSGGQGQ